MESILLHIIEKMNILIIVCIYAQLIVPILDIIKKIKLLCAYVNLDQE